MVYEFFYPTLIYIATSTVFTFPVFFFIWVIKDRVFALGLFKILFATTFESFLPVLVKVDFFITVGFFRITG